STNYGARHRIDRRSRSAPGSLPSRTNRVQSGDGVNGRAGERSDLVESQTDPLSGQDAANGLAVAKAHGAAHRIDQLPGGVDAEQMVDGRDHVGGGDRVARRVGGPPIAGAEDGPTPDASSGKHRREAVRPVVAAIAPRACTTHDRLADPRSP